MFKSPEKKDDRKKAPILIDKQAFRRTLKIFDHVVEGNLSNIQEKKNDLIFNIREELECLEKNLMDTFESNHIIEGNDSLIEEDDPLPTWLQLFLERNDSIKTKTEVVEQEKNNVPQYENETNTEKITLDDDINNNLSQHIDYDKFMATKLLENEDSILNHQSNKNNALKSKISKLRNVFNLPLKSSPLVHLKIPKYVATSDLKEKFEKPGSDGNKSGLKKAPRKKLISIPSFDTNHPTPLKKEQKNWKWKQENLKVVENTSSSLDGHFDDIPNDISDVASFSEKATIEKLLQLIDDSQAQPTEKLIRPSKEEKTVGHLKKCKTQDFFKDQTPSITSSPIVSKLSRSLSFLNRTDISVVEKSNNELRSNNYICIEAIKDAFENKNREIMSSGVMKNRVQKKIIQSPWSHICDLDINKEVSQVKEIKKRKPRVVTEEPLLKRLTGFQQPQTTKSIPSPDIINEIEKDEQPCHMPCQQIKLNNFDVKEDNSEDDLENILNYEDSSEIRAYEKELRARYKLDYRSSCDKILDNKSSMKPSNSFSSLMNILTTMRETRLTRSVSECKLNLLRSSETHNQRKIVNDNFGEIEIDLKDRKTKYERAMSCQSSKEDLKNICHEELEEVSLLRKKKVIRI